MYLSTKKLLIIASIVVIVLASLSTGIFAAVSGPPIEDASTYINNPTATTNDDRLRVEAGTPNCSASPTRYSYVKWNLADLGSATIGSATMKFTVQSVNLGGATAGAQQVVLYQTTDGWTETTLNWNNQPPLGTAIQSKTVPSTSGAEITFEGTDLVNYLNTEAQGDKIASFALALTGNCGESVVILRLYSKDHVIESSRPTLILLDPNSVSLSTFTTDTSAPTWPLYAGLGALVLIAVAGVAWSRRRAALR